MTFSGFILVWLLVMAVLCGLGFWLSSRLKKRHPEKLKLWWGVEMFPLAFALAPMGISAGYIGFIIPAGWGIVVGLISPETRTSEQGNVFGQCLLSVLVTWCVLWVLRWLFSLIDRRK